MRSGRALLGWILILGATACSAPSGGASSPPGVEPSLSGSGSPSAPSASTGESPAELPQAGWEWETADDQAPEDEETGPADGPVDGEPVGDAPTDEDPVVALEESEADEVVDPCSLVTTEEWSAWSGGRGASPAPQSLEDGDACGWIAAGDELRMAIGLFPAAADERWLTAGDIALATAVPGIGDHAWWLESWPVAQSSTLVVTVGQLDVVIEMSALTADHERLLDGALHFAELILGRIT